MDDYTRAWPTTIVDTSIGNAFVESFNGKLRLECLNTHWFTTLDDAQRETETWRADYNDVRPHSSFDDTPPAVFAAAHRETAA